jgi:hypothetical protein
LDEFQKQFQVRHPRKQRSEQQTKVSVFEIVSSRRSLTRDPIFTNRRRKLRKSVGNFGKPVQNTRLIVQDHVTSILNAPTMNKQSRTALRELLDTLTSNIAALKTLKIQVESWDALIIPIITEKLDYNTKKDWQTSLDTKVPTYGQFINSLEKRCTVLESLNSISTKSPNQAQSSNSSFQKSTQPSKSTVALAATNQNSNLCIYCKKANHSMHQCTEFLNLSIQSRNEKARLMKLCLNCLRNNHATSACRNTTKAVIAIRSTTPYCTSKTQNQSTAIEIKNKATQD